VRDLRVERRVADPGRQRVGHRHPVAIAAHHPARASESRHVAVTGRIYCHVREDRDPPALAVNHQPANCAILDDHAGDGGAEPELHAGGLGHLIEYELPALGMPPAPAGAKGRIKLLVAAIEFVLQAAAEAPVVVVDRAAGGDAAEERLRLDEDYLSPLAACGDRCQRTCRSSSGHKHVGRSRHLQRLSCDLDGLRRLKRVSYLKLTHSANLPQSISAASVAAATPSETAFGA